ncbi:MAG: hypothetical protein HPY61_10160 [Methanotrichaceae archaeon]|nr:hypothetical protein [Methanotrichaceae archaeon]
MVRSHIKLFTLQMKGTRSQLSEPRAGSRQRSLPDVVTLVERGFGPQEILSGR